MYARKTTAKIEDLLQEAVIIDGHSDLLIPMTEGKMRIRQRTELPDMHEWQAPD